MSYRQRRRFTIALVATLSLFVFVVALAVGGWYAVAKSAIRPGMARADIEARFGPPTGQMLAVGNQSVEAKTLVWQDRKIVVEFDETDCVRTVSRPPSLVDNLRSTLGL